MSPTSSFAMWNSLKILFYKMEHKCRIMVIIKKGYYAEKWFECGISEFKGIIFKHISLFLPSLWFNINSWGTITINHSFYYLEI